MEDADFIPAFQKLDQANAETRDVVNALLEQIDQFRATDLDSDAEIQAAMAVVMLRRLSRGALAGVASYLVMRLSRLPDRGATQPLPELDK